MSGITIREEHLKLLEKAYWEWCNMEYGAPWIDPKRPYGNSDVEDDIAEILGWNFKEDSDGEKFLSKEQVNKADEIHHELLDVIKTIIKEYTEAWRNGTELKHEKQ